MSEALNIGHFLAFGKCLAQHLQEKGHCRRPVKRALKNFLKYLFNKVWITESCGHTFAPALEEKRV
jgi:hypothetical protein